MSGRQNDAQIFLQLSDLLAHRRLRDGQQAGGSTEVQFPGHHDEGLHPAKVPPRQGRTPHTRYGLASSGNGRRLNALQGKSPFRELVSLRTVRWTDGQRARGNRYSFVEAIARDERLPKKMSPADSRTPDTIPNRGWDICRS